MATHTEVLNYLERHYRQVHQSKSEEIESAEGDWRQVSGIVLSFSDLKSESRQRMILEIKADHVCTDRLTCPLGDWEDELE